MNRCVLKTAMSYAYILLINTIRKPIVVSAHIIIAIICGLLILPNHSYEYTTFSISNKAVFYNRDSVIVIISSMFSLIYPLIGFLLISPTIKRPIPENLLSSFPVKKITFLMGHFIASFILISLHLIFITAIGSVNNLPFNLIYQIPSIIISCFLISCPALILTSISASIVEYIPFNNDKTPSLILVAIWLVWISAIGLILNGQGWDISGIKFPILNIFHQSNVNIGFIPIKKSAGFILNFNEINFTKIYFLHQILISFIGIMILFLFGKQELVLKITTSTSLKTDFSQNKAKGFISLSPLTAWTILLSRLVFFLFQSKVKITLAALLLILQLVTPPLLSEKASLVAWGLYITEWSGLGYLVKGKAFAVLESTLPLGGWKWSGAAIAAISLQMTLLSLGEMIFYPATILPKFFQITAVAFFAVFLLRITRSKIPFLIIAITLWYSMVTY